MGYFFLLNIFEKFSLEDLFLLILEREKWREEEVERNIDVRKKHSSVASCRCPDWESNLQPFGVWDDAPTH